jgi:hypothetical protein
MTSVVPGYVQVVVPTPQAGQGEIVHDVDTKKFVHTP